MTTFQKSLTGLFLLGGFAVQAQLKVAHINQAELLNAMPETITIEDSIKTLAEDLDAEYQLMVQDYLELKEKLDDPNMLPIVRATKEKQLQDMETNIAQFQLSAQEVLNSAQDTLLAPVVERIKQAIDDVCAEKGYSYVFDTSLGNPIFTDPKHDILGDVKKKLGLL